MAFAVRISKPTGSQPAGVETWQRSLRSPSPSRRTSIRTASSSMRRSGSASSLSRSGGLSPTITGRRSVSNELKDIEGEYIKNLQQQIYFLELEANYLREQARKATDMHPKMTAEAERMLSKLRTLQTDADGLYAELQRKESSLDVLHSEKERALQRLSDEEGSHAREKRLLMDEILTLKKDKDLLDRNLTRTESQFVHQRSEFDGTSSALRNSEAKIDMLRHQLDQKSEQQTATQMSLEDKRMELLRSETNLKEMEDKFYSSTVVLHDKAMQELREEIRMLRQRLRESEMTAEQDRFMKNKISDDSTHLIKENAVVNQQVLELQKQLDRERDLRETTDARRSQSMSELVVTKDREKQLQFDTNDLRQQLQREQHASKQYMDRLAKQEHVTNTTELDASTTRSKLAELESRYFSLSEENDHLRRDKSLLTDHVADLQRQLDRKSSNTLELQSRMRSLGHELDSVEAAKNMGDVAQAEKWNQLEHLADTMKSMSRNRTLRSRSPSPSPRNRSRLSNY